MYIDLKQINIEQNGIERNILDIMADQYAPKIQEELNKRWCCSPEKHEHIYTILARRGAENILKYSVEQMRDLIIELNNWELWSTFSSQGCGITKKDGITPFVSCSNCSLMKGIGQWKGTGKTCKQYDILKEIQTIFDYDNWCSDDNVDFKPYDFIK